MMARKTALFPIFFWALTICAQADTEVYLFDLNLKGAKIELSSPKNISNNKGYDNQPSFLNDHGLVFASTRADQTDILRFNIKDGGTSSWITDTPTGSEYSPLKIPGEDAVSAIRLDLDGLQRLYRYDIKTGTAKVLLEDLKIGYHVWFNDHIVVSTVLVADRMDLFVSNLKDGTNHRFQKNVGRSLHVIPNTGLISYISKENPIWEIKSLNPISGATQKITDTFKNQEDLCWLPDGTILAGNQKSIIQYNPKRNENWQPVISFSEEDINNITRIAVNSSTNRLAFVAERSPRHIVQEQLEAYNNRAINAFMDTYADDIKLYNYPNELISEGKEKMRQGYANFFETTPDLNCEIKNRMVISNKVIDEEYITANNTQFSAVAIYEVAGGKIVKVTFIR